MFLSINKQLSKVTEFGTIEIYKDEVKSVDWTKYLGLTIDDSLLEPAR